MSRIRQFLKLIPKDRSAKCPARGYWKGKNHKVRSQKRLNALRDYAVKPGENPFHIRLEAMNRNRRRKRLELKQQKQTALEMHELQQLARENAVAAMETLIEISKNRRAPEPSRIAASAVILDRGYGKASQVTMSANLNNAKANEITGDELDKRIGRTLKRVEELTRRAPKETTGQKRPVDIRKLN